MNLREKVRPNCGVDVRNGDEVFKGADYLSKKGDGRMTR